VWLELLHGLGGIVEEGKAGALATTELCSETEDGDLVLGELVKLAELLAELILRDVGARWVEDVTVKAHVLVGIVVGGRVAQFSEGCLARFEGVSEEAIRTRPSACVPAVGCG
jgi:hypothetical protein